MIIAVTDLSTYEYCPRKLFLKKILKLEEPPKEAMVLGTVRHEAFDNINKVEEKLVINIKEKIDYAKLLKKYKEAHSAILRNVIIKHKTNLKKFNLDLTETFTNAWTSVFYEAKERAFNIHQFMDKTGYVGEQLWEELTPKIESELRVSNKELKIRGIIDKIEVYPDLNIPVELKTGKMPFRGVWPGHQLQIGAYIMLLQQQGRKANRGVVNYLDHETKRDVPFNPILEDKIINIRDDVISMLTNDKLPEKVENENKCTNCSFKEKCYNQEFMEQRMKEVFN